MTFEEYLDERGRWLPGFARVLCGDRHLAQDVLQEVLLRAHKQWDRIGVLEHRDAYLRRMIVNEHLSWRRRMSRQVLRDHVDLVSVERDPADRFVDHAQVSSLLAGLPRRQRTAMVLRYYSDLSDNEIATAMGCSSGAVRSYLSRALASLRVELKAQSLAEMEN